MAADRFFAEVVSLACHDLRTPLATVHGFARTIERLEPEDERAGRYVGLIVEGSGQMAALLERLALVARIERGTYEPPRRTVDSLELASAAAALVRAGDVSVSGTGAPVEVDPDPTERSVRRLLSRARCGMAALDPLPCDGRGPELEIGPVSGRGEEGSFSARTCGTSARPRRGSTWRPRAAPFASTAIRCSSSCLLEQPRQPPVLEHAPAGLTVRAVVDRVLLEVHLSDRMPAGVTGLPRCRWTRYVRCRSRRVRAARPALEL